jgi:outer membrane lipoprotein-sorting protein
MGWWSMMVLVNVVPSICFLFLTSSLLAKTNSAEFYLEKAENIRNPVDDYVVQVELIDKKSGESEERQYEVFIQGMDKALVKYLTPKSEVGTSILMLGSDMWVKTPGSKKPIRISPQQKLTGNAAYGDITRLTFIGNYQATLLREDKFENQDTVVLKLNSIDGRPVTYDLVEYWIDKKIFRPLKTVYMTQSGKAVREGTYTDYQSVFGIQRPTTFILKNLLSADHVTTIKYKTPVKKSHPAMIFEKQNLGVY